MRYSGAENLVRLILRMQATTIGIALDDIRDEFGVNRRTAERMRDAVLRMFPETEVRADAERRKRWRIPGSIAHALVRWEAPELAALEAAIEASARDGLPDHAVALRGLRDKIVALIRDDARSRIAPDLEVLCEGQGHVMRPGPRPTVAPEALERLRWAILACRRVVLEYTPRGTATRAPSVVHPYGFLSGVGQYLVAFSERACEVHLYRLSRIASVEILEGDFECDPGFDLRHFAENSFGVFQEDPVDVAWRFDPELAADAAEFEFHPTQKTVWLEDGSLLVRFRAGGLLEMAWHLFRWGPGVEIIEPDVLREKLVTLLSDALVAHTAASHLP